MSNEVSKIEKQQDNSGALLSVIERVAMSDNADITKLEKMLDMQERVQNKQAQQSFTSDMAAMQGDMPRVIETSQAHNSTYAKLEDINDTIRPVLQRHGFAVTFNVEQNDLQTVKVTAILSHREGHTQTSSIVLPIDVSGKKNPVQAIGSSISYGKRYACCALLNISTGEDNNGYDQQPQAQEFTKVPLTENQEKKAIAMIKAGTYTRDALVNYYDVTPAQLQYIDEELAK